LEYRSLEQFLRPGDARDPRVNVDDLSPWAPVPELALPASLFSSLHQSRVESIAMAPSPIVGSKAGITGQEAAAASTPGVGKDGKPSSSRAAPASVPIPPTTGPQRKSSTVQSPGIELIAANGRESNSYMANPLKPASSTTTHRPKMHKRSGGRTRITLMLF